MDKELIEFMEQEKKYRDEALNNAKGYLSSRTSTIDLKKVQSIIIPLLKSYEFKIKQARSKAIKALEVIKFDLVKKNELTSKIDSYNNRILAIQRITRIDFANNGFVNGKITYGLSEEFSLEDQETYTLFHEVKNYYEKYSKDDDKERLEILSRLYKLKSLTTSAKNDVITKEQQFIQDALKTIKRELEAFNDLTIKDIFAAANDFIHAVNNHKHNSDYITELYISHYPQYEDKVKDSFDGFGEDAKDKTSRRIKQQLLSIGFERERSLVHSSTHDMVRIYDLIERKQEVEELLSLVERAEIALEKRNHAQIDGASKAILDYDQAVISAQDLRKYCEVLLDKYDKELEELRYFELEDNIEAAMEATDIVSSIEQRDVKEDYTSSEERPKESTPSVKSVDEMNNKMIIEMGISNELLKLAIDDLCIFGFLNTNVIEELKPYQVTQVITHALRLREIASLSDEDKTLIRATWSRIEKGKVVQRETPTQEDVLNQKTLDNINNIINRINLYATSGEMNL